MMTQHVFTRDDVSLSLRDLSKVLITQKLMDNSFHLVFYHGTISTSFDYQADYEGCRTAFDAVTTYMQENAP